MEAVTATETPSHSPNRNWTVAIIALVLLAGWMHIALSIVMPWLWGPYSIAFSDAGPLIVSRLGTMLALVILPLLAVAIPLAKSRSVQEWIVRQIGGLLICGAAILAHGYYLHHVVSWQTTEDSLEFIALEVGFKDAASVPQNVKEALLISDRLAKEGKAPWLPGQWREVQWPEIPHQSAK